MRKTIARVLLAAFFLSGCSSRSSVEERLDGLDQAVAETRLNEARMALLEDRVNELAVDVTHLRGLGGTAASGSRSEAARRQSAQPRPVAPKAAGTASATAGDTAVSTVSGRQARGEQKDYARALALFEAGKPGEARALFAAFLAAHSSGALTPNAGYWLGECEYALGQYDKAILAFKDVVSRYPGHPKAAASMLKTGYAYERLGDKENARFYLTALLEDFPQSEPALLARKKLAAL